MKAPNRTTQLSEHLSGGQLDFDAWLTAVSEWSQADACRLYVWHEETGAYRLIAAQGRAEHCVHRFAVKVGEGLVGYTAQREEPLTLSAPASHPKYLALPGRDSLPALHFATVPMIHRGVMVGILVVERLQGDAFDSVHEAQWLTIAAQGAAPLADWVAKHRDPRHWHQAMPRITQDTQLFGVAASAGVAMGTVVIAYGMALNEIPDRHATDIAHELSVFQQALHAAQQDIQNLIQQMALRLPAEELSLLDAYDKILSSSDLVEPIREKIQAGQWAPGALRQVIMQRVDAFAAMDDAYLKERGMDIHDLGERILRHLLAVSDEPVHYPEKTVLVADELTATMLLAVPAASLVGIVAARGAQNAHTAILARSLGIPAVLGVQGLPLATMEGVEIVVDGYFGQILLSPSDRTQKNFARYMAQEAEIDQQLNALKDQSAQTLDGHALTLSANVGLASELSRSLHVGADGIGLYRTEIPFMQRDRFPSEQEQYDLYRSVLQAFAPQDVVMRVLDVGGDKILPYFPIEEHNPFMGWRGLRIMLDHPEILLLQLRAMLRASVGLDHLHILLPMVTHTSELEAALRFVHQAYEEVKEEHPTLTQPVLGAMLEVPSAVYQINALSRHVDFFSIGSNDLLQFFMAVDRNNAHVAALHDGLHPSVLRLLQQAVHDAHSQGKKISICGELASDAVAVMLLLGMGFDQLSVAPIGLPKIKWVVRSVTMTQAKEVLAQALTMDDAVEVRALVEQAMEAAGLGALLRAGQ